MIFNIYFRFYYANYDTDNDTHNDTHNYTNNDTDHHTNNDADNDTNDDTDNDADGQLQTGTFADYLLPGATDFPRLRAVVLGNYPAPHNPLGAKGGGEGGIVPVGGVIANALAAALSSFDVQPHSLPLSPDRVWTMIEEAGAATDRTKPPQSFRTD